MQDREEEELEEKFKEVDLVFQEIKDQQEYEAMEKKFARVDLLFGIVKDREYVKIKKQKIKQLSKEIKLLVESFRLSEEIIKLCGTTIELLDQKAELSRQLRAKNVPSLLNEKHIEQKKREIEQLNEQIKLLVKRIKLSGEWTELLETKTELSEQLNELRTRLELKAQYKKKSDIFMAAIVVSIIVDSTMQVLFAMNLVSLEIMLYSTIASAAVSLICLSLAIYHCSQATIEVDTKLSNNKSFIDQLDIEKFSQNKKILPCG